MLLRLRLLVELKHRGSISAAADACRLGQPSATKHLKTLEAALAEKLSSATSHSPVALARFRSRVRQNEPRLPHPEPIASIACSRIGRKARVTACLALTLAPDDDVQAVGAA